MRAQSTPVIEFARYRSGVNMASTSEQPRTYPESVPVTCGGLRATLLVDKGRILHSGTEMSPTEFEKLGGRAATKKWKQSVRLVQPDGSDGGPIGNWLTEHHITIGPVRPVPSNVSLRPSKPSVLQTPVCRAVPAVKAEPAAPPMPHVLEHLQKQCIGLLHGDPTAARLPNELPADDFGGRVVIDPREMSEEDLSQLAAVSAEDPLAAMLSEAPGVEEGRVARFTGHQPKRKAFIVDKAKASAALDLYLWGKLQDPPWAAMGIAKPPILNGKTLNLRNLWQEVQASGGYEACTAAKLWSRIATKLGVDLAVLTNGSYLVRTHYQRLLLAKEEQRDQANTPSDSQIMRTDNPDVQVMDASQMEDNTVASILETLES